MRQPGAVYRKLREVRYRYLAEMYRQYFRRLPENCRYFRNYVFTAPTLPPRDVCVRLCLIHQENPNSIEKLNPAIVDVCSEKPGCSGCNVWVPKLTKDQVRDILDKELKDKEIRQRKYPDICALEWVLERSVVGTPSLRWLQKAWFTIKRKLLKNRIL